MKRCLRMTSVLLVAWMSITPGISLAQDDKAAVTQTMRDSYAPWADLGPSFDLQRVLPYYHEPMMVVTAARVFIYPTRADVEVGFQALAARLRQRGAVRSELQQLHVQQLGAGVAVASVQTVRRRVDGQELDRVGYLYVLRKTNDGWKITTIVSRDPGTVLRLD